MLDILRIIAPRRRWHGRLYCHRSWHRFRDASPSALQVQAAGRDDAGARDPCSMSRPGATHVWPLRKHDLVQNSGFTSLWRVAQVHPIATAPSPSMSSTARLRLRGTVAGMTRLWHLAEPDDWVEAQITGFYERSTRGVSLT